MLNSQLYFIAKFTGLGEIVKSDKLIVEFGKCQILRLGPKEIRRPSDLTPIRTKLRTIARLLYHVREEVGLDCKWSIQDVLKPERFKQLTAAAIVLSNKNDQLGLTIGGYVKQLLMLKLAESVMNRNTESEEEAKRFQFLYDTYWLCNVTSVAGKQQRHKKINTQEEIPLTGDLNTLSKYLKEQIMIESDKSSLRKLCLSFLILFNKRRPMEVAELTKKNFLEAYGATNQDNEEIVKSLTEAERILAKR